MNLAISNNEQFSRTYENVHLLNKTKIQGIIYLTQTQLIFTSSSVKFERKIYYSWIASIDKLPLSTDGSPFAIKCKNFLTNTFIISNEKDCLNLVSHLGKYSKPTSLLELCCFLDNHHLSYLRQNYVSRLSDKLFDLDQEYARMGVPNKEWTQTDLNSSYQLCDTYSTKLYVPSSASEQILKGSASFRSRGRLAVLSYYLNKNGASITRCSQPLAGLSNRCMEDEQLLDCILKTNQTSSYMYVVDTRPKINALANKAAGKGYENENFYTNIQFYFFGIENIHVMRNSLAKLIETCETPNLSMSQYLTGIEKSEWLKHIQLIMQTSLFIAEAVNNQGINVLVHCSDGWDRTAQTCALSELLIDPYYRSIHGLQILIEKEWLMFGHKFSERCGHTDNHDAKEMSPIFTQFLDCIHQLQLQFPCSFEFNELLLLEIHDHLYSCLFGTFIGNCERERHEMRVKERTLSLWDYIHVNINKYLNPLYKPNSTFSNDLLVPNTRLTSMRIWKRLYCRHEMSVQPRENELNQLMRLKERNVYLEDYVKSLEKRLSEAKSTSLLEKLDLDGKKDINSYFKLVEWKSLRCESKCLCSNSTDTFVHKRNCWKCGELFCDLCVDFMSIHLATTRCAFICKNCRDKQLQTSEYTSKELFYKFSINNSDLVE